MEYTFISGATGGIGKAFAFSCAKRGYALFLTGRSDEKLAALRAELLGVFPETEIKCCACQLTDENSRAALISYADGEKMLFDRIINVAGADIQKAFTDYTAEKVVFQIRVNVESTIALTHAFLKRSVKGVEIITVSSMSGVTPMPYFALYSATKAALTNFFRALRTELAGYAKVTVVLPGGVPTRPDIIEDIKNQGIWGRLSSKTPTYVAENSLKKAAKNKAAFIPGGFNKFLYFIMKITPLPLTLRFIGNRWSKQTKDSF